MVLYIIGAKGFSNSKYGAQTGPIFFWRVRCRQSSAVSLLDCSYYYNMGYCDSHYDDFGVECEGTYGTVYLIVAITHLAFRLSCKHNSIVDVAHCSKKMKPSAY